MGTKCIKVSKFKIHKSTKLFIYLFKNAEREESKFKLLHVTWNCYIDICFVKKMLLKKILKHTFRREQNLAKFSKIYQNLTNL